MLLKMTAGMSGPLFDLAPGDEYEFEGDEVDGIVTGEAGRLIDAGFAVKAVAEDAPAAKKRGKADVVPTNSDAANN